MDWGNVSLDELLDGLREVEWSTPPRSLPEFFQKFSIPKNSSKWSNRIKCNVYYYRTNYIIILTLILVFAFFRNVFALFSVSLTLFSLACLNDSFAILLNERLIRGMRKVYPPLVTKMRNPSTRPAVRGGRSIHSPMYICGQDRRVVVVSLFLASFLFWYLTKAFITVFGSLFLATALIFLHASLRSPNLKARLNTYREEFRAVWRNYNDA